MAGWVGIPWAAIGGYRVNGSSAMGGHESCMGSYNQGGAQHGPGLREGWVGKEPRGQRRRMHDAAGCRREQQVRAAADHRYDMPYPPTIAETVQRDAGLVG
jgi:hypothetical protein